MTSTFNVGDHVRIVDDSDDRNIGKKATVRCISGHLTLPITVEFIDQYYGWHYRRCYHQDELVKINQEPEEDLYI